MLTSLFTGVSGMNAHMDELSVVGHNIANMNTYGFKGSRSYFADLLSQSLEGITGPNQIGAGVQLNAAVKTFPRVPSRPRPAHWTWPSRAAAFSSSKI